MRSTMRNQSILLLVGGLLAATPALAEGPRPFIDEPRPMSQRAPEEIEEPVRQEGEVRLPAYPRDEGLVEFRADDRFRYLLDRAALSVGRDEGAVYYTVVIESTSGARNVAYEGIRCETLEYKIYAYGDKGGAFQPVRNPAWKEIRADQYNRFRRDLHDFFLCENLLPRSPGDIQRALEKGGEEREGGFGGG
jgi:hypothetical protein